VTLRGGISTKERIEYPVQPPHSIADLGRWLNEWALLDDYERLGRLSPAWLEGYGQAIRDVYEEFDRLLPDWATPKNQKANE
jgi:hypothetical protein